MTRQEKLTYLKAATDNALSKVAENVANWREFLRFYANIYKYQFSEALQIYEQNPNVTMCGEIKHWNAIERRVHKGTYGIPILSETDKDMEIRYVFDVTNTYGEDIPEMLTLPNQYKSAVFAEIESRFRTVTPEEIQNNYDKKFKNVIEEYVRETCLNYIEGLQYEVKDSYLEELDTDNLRKHFTDTVVDSVGYIVCEKLGLEKGIYDDDTQAFQYLYAFNTKAVMD